MKSRLFTPSKTAVNYHHFACLKNKTVINAKISDHHPMIHDGVLFWNVMMQGKLRNSRTGLSYNNGFGIVETDEDYSKRLIKIAQVIAELVYRYPAIEVISLCEGPIQSAHITLLFQALKQSVVMQKFFGDDMDDALHKPHLADLPQWGLFMLADQRYKVDAVDSDFIKHPSIIEKLANRIQLWQLTKNATTKYLALGHFPFGGDEHVADQTHLSTYGDRYCQLVKNMLRHYANEHFILCADFNFNPYLISEWNDRVLDQITHHNSQLLIADTLNQFKIDTVTVDGILLSKQEKQKYYSLRFNPGLFSRLRKENHLFQTAHEKSLALVPYRQ